MRLNKYFAKRDFKLTPEPKGKLGKSGDTLIYVIQKHQARRLHYDFRLEWKGTLLSWAIPKGPSLDPKDKRLAVMTEDHPIEYAKFEGTIPEGEYGAGDVIVWDYGSWTPIGNMDQSLKIGRLDIELFGERLFGKWTLIRLKGLVGTKSNWLFFKRQDKSARSNYDIVTKEPGSVLQNRKTDRSKSSKTIKSAKANSVFEKTPSPSKKTKKSSLPEFIKPQLAQLVGKVPAGSRWVHEIKFDGYRTLCRIEQDRVEQNDVRLFTRSGLDWTEKYGPIRDELKKLKVDSAILDGEIVWIDDDGRASFQGLQNALQEKRFSRMTYYLFDLLFLNGEDLREQPLLCRKEKLLKLLGLQRKSKLLYSEHWIDVGEQMLKHACELKLEGIVSKDADGAYLSGRNNLWQKSKCTLRQEFVIGGYTDSPSPGRAFGALLMGSYDEDKKLVYLGRVGTGFTDDSIVELKKKLLPLEQKDSPFDRKSPRGSTIHWLKPQLLGEVEFRAWTGDGMIRYGSFQGLRADKKTKDVHVEIEVAVKSNKTKFMKKSVKAFTESKLNTTREIKIMAKQTPPSSKNEKAVKVSGLNISHPSRIVFPETQTSKLDIVKYYDAVSDFMLPFMQDRPLSILRCQDSTADGCFFQKHAEGSNLVGIGSKSVHYKDKKGSALVAETHEDILQLAQAGTLEIHGWNGQFKNITKPDTIVFDLDPETEKLWPRVVGTALRIREMLRSLGLESFVKVTGGKGLHVQVPIQPLYTWDLIKLFSKSLMKVLEDERPKDFTVNMSKAKRKDRIFLDYLRNGYGATAVLPYSLRARAHPAVALPVEWSQIKNSLSPDQFEIYEVIKILNKRKDPWKNYWKTKQRIKVLDSPTAKSALAENSNLRF